MNYAQIKAVEAKNKERWLKVNPMLTDGCGVYVMTREEAGIKYAYIGQAKHVLTRLAQHLAGYQHIDLSLKKHGLYHELFNSSGWRVSEITCNDSELDYWERYYILEYASKGFQLRNKTSGGQGEGKRGLSENKPSRGYHDGLRQGYENARREIKHLFDLYLTFKTKSDKPNKNQEKAVRKFQDFLNPEG